MGEPVGLFLRCAESARSSFDGGGDELCDGTEFFSCGGGSTFNGWRVLLAFFVTARTSSRWRFVLDFCWSRVSGLDVIGRATASAACPQGSRVEHRGAMAEA